MGVQGTKKSAEELHEIFMGNFLFLSSFLSRHRSEKHPSQTFWVQEACRNGSCGPILDHLGEGGTEKALPFPVPTFFFFLILTSCFPSKLRYICFLPSLRDPKWILTIPSPLGDWRRISKMQIPHHLSLCNGFWEKVMGSNRLVSLKGEMGADGLVQSVLLRHCLQAVDLLQSQEAPGTHR